MNWYSELSDKLTLTNVLYYSGGHGGGTGTLGSIEWDYSHAQRVADWDATIANNRANTDADGNPVSAGILRNSRNNQWTIGDILKLSYQASDELEIQAGLDWRTAEIEHYREVRDLLGGDYYIESNNDFNADYRAELGDKVAYNFTNTVDWIGGYVQSEYETDKYSVYATGGISTIKYNHENFFLEENGNPLTRETDNIMGYQVKAGGLYSINDNLDAFANVGVISKVPIFDNVINDGTGAINEDPVNEKFFFYEGGVRFRDAGGKFGVNANYYLTDRRDRSFTQGVDLQNGDEGIINITGLDQIHSGIELETSYKALDWVRLDVAGSYNIWEYQSDVSAVYTPDLNNPGNQQNINLYVDGLKVGNAPQAQVAYVLGLTPTRNFDVQLVGTSFYEHYSDFNPLDRDDASDRVQPWKAPNYTVFNLHINYTLDEILKGTSLFLNVFNALNETYIQDAVDNSSFNGFDADHDADDAEVFLGLPRRYNFGIRVNF